MASYQSQRGKIKMYIDGAIRSVLMESNSFNDREIDYNKFLNCIVSDLGVSKSMAEDCLKGFIDADKLIEYRALRFPKPEEIEKEAKVILDKAMGK